MRDSQQAPMIGQKVRTVIPRWCVKTRSKMGEEAIAAATPAKIRAAPIRPEVVSE